jgi:prolyl-tRNA synthetase
MARDTFVAEAPRLLKEIQDALYTEAKQRLDANISTGVRNVGELEEFFGAAADEEEASDFKGWVRASWSRPSGPELAEIEQTLKAMKLTVRNAPLQQGTPGKCLFTGERGIEDVLIARAY